MDERYPSISPFEVNNERQREYSSVLANNISSNGASPSTCHLNEISNNNNLFFFFFLSKVLRRAQSWYSEICYMPSKRVYFCVPVSGHRFVFELQGWSFAAKNSRQSKTDAYVPCLANVKFYSASKIVKKKKDKKDSFLQCVIIISPFCHLVLLSPCMYKLELKYSCCFPPTTKPRKNYFA